MSLADDVTKHARPWLIQFVLLGGLAFAIIATWNNSRDLKDQAKAIGSLAEELIGLKEAVVAVVITDPEKAALIQSLVHDPRFRQGIEDFSSGRYVAAFSTWEESAAHGTTESAFAIGLAKAALEQRIDDPSTSDEERRKLRLVLEDAPDSPATTSDLRYRRE